MLHSYILKFLDIIWENANSSAILQLPQVGNLGRFLSDSTFNGQHMYTNQNAIIVQSSSNMVVIFLPFFITLGSVLSVSKSEKCDVLETKLEKAFLAIEQQQVLIEDLQHRMEREHAVVEELQSRESQGKLEAKVDLLVTEVGTVQTDVDTLKTDVNKIQERASK